ncbi:MAG: PhzF family phenazine biosynthesis protein [Candidatus Heimdallarchaeota archaeon]|nr:PhzF family phenazine biosynthesis protein [Candidatus Heimdallarchaeota archaeon]
MRIKIPFVQTSVFIDDRYNFSGNQLATFWDSQENKKLSMEEMQGITREMNFSESTFLFPSMIGNCSSKVRIFTPGREIPFAGHPTLGTAFVLKEKEIISMKTNQTTMELGIGPIDIQFTSEYISMKQPRAQFLEEFPDVDLLASILNLKRQDFSNDYIPEFVSTGFPFLIIHLKSLAAVQNASPNVRMLLENLKSMPSQELLIFSNETVHPESTVHVRMFAPSAGVPEDPATGSAAGPLGVYLLKYNIGKVSLDTPVVIEQGYEMNRPSQLLTYVQKRKNADYEVHVSGKVRKTAEGIFFLDK